jgi:3-hydroxyacyl-CoA dehydrogenase/enoyl-CoA hydratase/3-hydroxybutyryl-CoA epimerase/enoyl-CoA isomerase
MSIYSGQAVQVREQSGYLELIFDLQGESANKFNALTLKELGEAWDAIEKKNPKGVLMTSAKDSGFVMGADITEFTGYFAKSEADIEKWMQGTQTLFNRIEDAKFPVIVAINGFALGGGFEVCLAAHLRVAAATAKVGLPETKLGIIPGWGGTVRMARLCGADNAIEWICSGNHNKAQDALKIGAVDAVCAPDQLKAVAGRMLEDCMAGKLDWKSRRGMKADPLKLSPIESAMSFDAGKAFIGAQAGPNYPAPIAAIDAIQQGAKASREEAQKIEIAAFIKMAKTPQAHALVGVFLADQAAKRKAKKMSKGGVEVKQAAVLGAGIMGGGIAYTSATSRVPTVMKDINDAALALGMTEAAKLLGKRVERGQMKPEQASQTLTMIRPTLSYGEMKNADIIIEAVTENPKVKKSVYTETEAVIREDVILASNTSTISISWLAEGLKRPENFVGMHFFNPVHRMPLVEIIRGKKTSEKAVATAVALSAAMGKTAIVVNDCPGFLVNRVLFPYFGGFSNLMRDGADFQRIDKVMEKFGWPMGPAYLLDVVGIDTAHHAQEVMAEGFPDRMKYTYRTAIDAQYEAKRFGQKNGKGFYSYTTDPKGKPKKEVDAEVANILKPVVQGSGADITDEDIVFRMMLPMIFECSRCLEDKIVEQPYEIDLSMLYGLGFPPFRGGVMRYADGLGAEKLVQLGEKYAPKLGKLYEPTEQIRQMAKSGKKFYEA